ncbi:MAG TPA: DJ-1/PfpI family protein [Verrucomicrobiae bacterium]|jgi:transcriptional regulator GlxA family with amidase domain|nr:DJ-1/PfpI family protein [Verrucomicrobiae bacterium]
MNNLNVQIVIFDGFDELDAIGPYEIWRMAKELKPGVEVQLVTLESPGEITAANGLRVRSEAQLGKTRPTLVVVPGGGWLTRAPTGAWAEAQRGLLPAKLAQLHRDGVILSSVCTGAMLLSAAGLLRNRPATTNHGAVEDLFAAETQVIRARVVDDGDIITAAGITSGLDLTLWLVERFLGAPTAHTLEGQLEYERRGTVWKKT